VLLALVVAMAAAVPGGCAGRRTGTPPVSWDGLEDALAEEANRRGVVLAGGAEESISLPAGPPPELSPLPEDADPADVAEAVLSATEEVVEYLTSSVADAQRAQEIVRLNCLNDKRAQALGMREVARSSAADLPVAEAAGDDAWLEHELTKLTLVFSKIQTLLAEANACVEPSDIAMVTVEAAPPRTWGFLEDVERWTLVRVFYGTDRQVEGGSNPTTRHGDEPRCPLGADGKPPFPAGDPRCVELGEAVVSIPPDHELGQIESPSVFRLEFRRDPEHHMVLKKVTPLDGDKFLDRLGDRLEDSERRQVLVFVHGYNTTFEHAVLRTAQMVHDLEFDGVGVAWSWGSQGTLTGYWDDERSVAASAPHLRAFLETLAEDADVGAIHVVAHSMGNRALAGALEAAPGPDGAAISQLVLAAPDIDAALFRTEIAPHLQHHAERITLYASDTDRALQASRLIHGGRRAGDSGGGVVEVPWVQAVDASGLHSSLLGHSYVQSTEVLLRDLAAVLAGVSPGGALRRWLQALPGGGWGLVVP